MPTDQNHVRSYAVWSGGSGSQTGGSGTMTDSCLFPQVVRGEYLLNTLSGLEQVWNRHATHTQRNINFEILHLLVWNGGVWNGI